MIKYNLALLTIRMAKRLGASVTIIRERTVDARLEETDLVTKKAAEVLIR